MQRVDDKQNVELNQKRAESKEQVINKNVLFVFRFQLGDRHHDCECYCNESQVAQDPEWLSHDVIPLQWKLFIVYRRSENSNYSSGSENQEVAAKPVSNSRY